MDISTKTILKFFLIAGALAFAYIIGDILIVLFLSVIIASAIDPAASWLVRRKIPRVLSVLLIYLAVVSLVILVFYLIIPVVLADIEQLSNQLPSYYDSFYSILSKAKISLGEQFSQNIQKLSFNLSGQIKAVASGIFPAFFSVFKGTFGAIIVFIISFYLAVQEKGVEKFLRLVIPIKQEDYVIDLWRRSEKKLSQWFYGQLLLGVVIGYLVFVGLTVAGVKYALILAIIAGLLEIIPMVGPIISALLATAIALFQSPMIALITLGVFIVIQQIENNLIVPIVMNKITGLNPVIVIVALLIGAKLGGVLGMIIAVPLTSILAEFLDDYAKNKMEKEIEEKTKIQLEAIREMH